jgi:hypothetical protein
MHGNPEVGCALDQPIGQRPRALVHSEVSHSDMSLIGFWCSQPGQRGMCGEKIWPAAEGAVV